MALMIFVLFLLVFITLLTVFLHPLLFIFFSFITVITFLLSVRIIYEYQRGILFTLGKYSGLLNPGLNFIIPLIQRVTVVDLRLNVNDVPEQFPITKDNVSIKVDAVIYYKVMRDIVQKSIIEIQYYHYAINQLAQTTMRNVIGEMTLDEILSNRDEASKKIQLIVDRASDPWGIKVEAVELKHIELPESMKKIMAKAAEAERIKRAVVIKASGEAMAAEIISKAAEIISSVDGGLTLRTIQEMDGIASDPSNEVHFFIPLDLIKPIEGYKSEKEMKNG